MLLEARKPEASDSVEGLGPGEVDTQGEALSVKEGDAPGVGGATGSAESAFARAASASGAEELRAALAAAGREARRTVLSSLSPVHGRSLLHLAAASGDSDKTRALLSLGARVNAKARDDECTPLHLAAAGGHKDTIRVLVMAGALLNPVVPGGWTPLHLAIQNGHRQSADFLSANGANIRQPTQFRLTPLHLAAWHGHKGIAADLLWRGAQPTARDKCGRTPMHLACWGGNGTLARMLASRAPQLLSIADADGGTPLHDAALNNRVSVISALREMKPQWNRKNKFGHTPLHEATRAGHVGAVAELISSGADVNTLTSYGCTALHLAIALGEMGCFRQLLRAQDIAINCSTADGNTPLHWAVWYGLTEAVDALLSLDADSTLTDNGGNTPLHWAAFQGLTPIAARLISASSAPLSLRNEAGKSPMDLAREWSHYECGALLLSAATGEAFSPLVPQRLSSSLMLISEDERPLLSHDIGGIRRCGQGHGFGPLQKNLMEQIEERDSFRTSSDWLNSIMKAPIYGSQANYTMSRKASLSWEADPMEMTRRATPVLSQSGSFTWPSNLQEISQPTSSVRGGYSTSPAYATGACDLPAGLGVSQNPLTHPQATRLPSQDGSPRSWPLAASISAVPPELLSSDLCRPWSLAVDDLQLCSAQVVSTGGINGSQEVLGVGPWGPVYKGLLYKTDMVAIRKFPLRGDKEHLSATMSALDHLHSLRHPSLVMFLGAAVLQDEIWLVSELVDGHTLEADLQGSGWGRRVHSAMLSCAKALNYLHHQRPPVVHGNLSAGSVLLCDGSRSSPQDHGIHPRPVVVAKLSGTKMLALEYLAADAQLRDAEATTSSQRPAKLFQENLHRPECHQAPEVAAGSQPGTAADIYCLGQLLLRATGGGAKGTRDAIRLQEALGSLVRWCLQPEPAARPTAAEVVRELEAL